VITFVPLLFVLVAVASVFVASTRTGIGVTPDSVSYVEGARSIADGDGYTYDINVDGRQAIKRFPPLYSTLLAVPEVAGIGALAGARIVDGVLLAATTALLYVLVLRSTRGSHTAAALAGAAFGLSVAIVRLSGFALSESLFLFLVAAWAIAAHELAGGGGWRSRAALVALSALAPLARFAGIALVIALPIVLLVVERGPRRRVPRAVLLTCLAAAPAALWALRNARVHGEAEVRHLGVHIVGWSKVRDGVTVVAGWFFPSPIPDGARRWLLLALILGVGLAIAIRASGIVTRARRPVRDVPGPVALTVFGVVYVLLLASIISFADAFVMLDVRQLAPLFVVLLVDIAVAGVYFRPPVRAMILVAASAVVLLYAADTVNAVEAAPIKERGLTATFFARSELLQIARGAGDGVVVYSEAPDLIYANTGLRNLHTVPERYDPHTLVTNTAFDDEVRRLGEAVRTRRAVVVLFNRPRPQLMNAQDLLRRSTDLSVSRDAVGIAFSAP